MKRDYSIPAIVLSLIFCACSLGINIIYLKYFPALYIVGIAISGITIFVTVIGLILRLKRQDGDEQYRKMLMFICMICATSALAIPVVGTLIVMFV